MLFGSTVIAGCSSFSRSVEPPETEETTIEVRARDCIDTGENKATVSFGPDDSQVTITGTIRVPRTDQILYVDTRNGVGYENRANDEMEVRIHYLSPDSDSTIEGRDCAGTLDYEADVVFSPAPSSVIVRHVTDINGDAVLETITTAEP